MADPKELSHYASLRQAITPGRWRLLDLRHQKNGQIRIHSDAPGCYGSFASVMARSDRPDADAQFIASAPEMYDTMQARIEALEAENARILRDVMPLVHAEVWYQEHGYPHPDAPQSSSGVSTNG